MDEFFLIVLENKITRRPRGALLGRTVCACRHPGYQRLFVASDEELGFAARAAKPTAAKPETETRNCA